jgi:hypothetical protein
MPITKQMGVLTAVRLVLVVAMSCVVLAGCGGGDVSTEASKNPSHNPACGTGPRGVRHRQACAEGYEAGSKPMTSDGPGYKGHPHLPAMSSLSPSERLDLTVGAEANSTEFKEVSSVVHGYLDARAEGDWELACSFVSPVGQRLLQGLAEKEGYEDTSCPAALPRQIADSPEELQKEASLADVGSVRLAAKRAFATYVVANALRVVALSGISGEWGITIINPKKLG